MSIFTSTKNDADVNSEDRTDESSDANLWLNILQEVEKAPNKLPSSKNLLVLGDNGSGKTSLIARLKGNNEPCKGGSGLEYHYIDVQDEYREDHTRLGCYVLDGDLCHRNLLRFVLSAESIADTTVLLLAAMSEPWEIIDALKSWAAVLEAHIERLRLSEEKKESLKTRVSRRFHGYCEPGADRETDGVITPRSNTTDLSVSTQKNCLQGNLGVDIIVVVTKTDMISTLEKDLDYKPDQLEFIQMAIRQFCLTYGAALFYLSVKENKNCDLLIRYLNHRIYDFKFSTTALFIEKDGLFIPSGWDSTQKIDIIIDNLTSVSSNEAYNDVIIRPVNRKNPMHREPEISAEEDEAFLGRLQSLLNQQTSLIGRPQESLRTPPPGVQKSADRRISGSPGVASPKKIDGKAASSVAGEGVLQNFFNSLLNRKTGSPIASNLTPARSPGDKTAVRQDAVAELERLGGSKGQEAEVSLDCEQDDSINESQA